MKKMTTEEKVLKLKYYAENYEDLIKELNRMSWWGKRKFIKTLKHCLPIYPQKFLSLECCPKKYRWHIKFQYVYIKSMFNAQATPSEIIGVYATALKTCSTYDVCDGIIANLNNIEFSLDDYINYLKRGSK
jgi:hypothetical protein